MKKELLLLVFLLTFLHVYSQEFIPGIRVGLNRSDLKSTQFAGTTPRVGLDVGLTFTAVMSDRVEILSEFTFSQKGATVKGYNDLGQIEDCKMHFNALQYAAVINYYIKAPNLSLQAGPFFAVNNQPTAGNWVVFDNDKNSANDVTSEDLARGVAKVDIGPAVGISGGTESIRINLRYMLGMVNYFKNADNEMGYKATGSSIHLSVSYLFNGLRFGM